MDKIGFAKKIVVTLAREFHENGMKTHEYPIMIVVIFRIFIEAWYKASRLPPEVAANLLEDICAEMIEDFKEHNINNNLN